jgi:hypothetical protein
MQRSFNREKRKSRRLLTYLPIGYRLTNGGLSYMGDVVNAGREGLLIKSTETLATGATFGIEVLFPKGFERNSFEGLIEIVWGGHCEGKAEHEYGVRFVRIAEHDRNKLDQLLHGRIQKEDAKKIHADSRGFEMRGHPRRNMKWPIEYWMLNSPLGHRGKTINLSKGGLMADFSEQVQIGQRLQLAIFTIPGSTVASIEMTGQVVWIDISTLNGSRGDYRGGLRILHMPREDQVRLQELLKGF